MQQKGVILLFAKARVVSYLFGDWIRESRKVDALASSFRSHPFNHRYSIRTGTDLEPNYHTTSCCCFPGLTGTLTKFSFLDHVDGTSLSEGSCSRKKKASLPNQSDQSPGKNWVSPDLKMLLGEGGKRAKRGSG